MAKEKHLTWLVSIYVSDFKVSLVCLFWNNEIIHNFKAPKFAILNILVFCFLKNTFVHQLSNPFFMSRQSPNIQHGINKSPSQSFSIHKALHWMEWQIAAATPLLSTAVTPSPIPPQRNNNVPAFKIQTKWGLLRTYTYANTRTHTHWSYPSCGGNEDNNGNAEGQRQYQSRQHGGSLFHTLQESPVEPLVAAAHPLSDCPPGDRALPVLLLVNILVPPHVDAVSVFMDLVGEVSGWRGALFLSIHAPVSCRVHPLFIAVVVYLFDFRSV